MDYATAFERLMGAEGGYVNDPNDPGGETKWGISKRTYPSLNIAGLTREDARVIYQRDFWNRIHASELHDGVAFQTFDFAVNSGVDTAVRYLQRTVRVVDDGNWGPKSRAAAAAMSESDTIMRLNALRLNFMTHLSNWPAASRGWARRISSNLLYGAEDS